MLYKKILVISFFILAYGFANAQKTAEGYIIGLKNDTTKITIRLQKFKGDASYSPFNMGMFALSVTCIGKDGTDMEFTPDKIKGFDFDYKDLHYEYRSLNISKADPVVFQSDDAPSYIFAQMLVKDEPIHFYKFRFNWDLFKKYDGVASQDNYYFNFYAVMKSKVISISHTYKKDELMTILRDSLKLEEAFIATVPKGYGFFDLQKVIESYDDWKKTHS